MNAAATIGAPKRVFGDAIAGLHLIVHFFQGRVPCGWHRRTCPKTGGIGQIGAGSIRHDCITPSPHLSIVWLRWGWPNRAVTSTHTFSAHSFVVVRFRSEERRVGKEW